ncbi:MAG: SUMF1/EgtB/PvdO family nonheme iron enzyme [candidate division KSB1 bacterium]|nr:SUMF1/EgtB/PvdO family nonheme iron enzyme [candidate division KSB1 bacterium]
MAAVEHYGDWLEILGSMFPEVGYTAILVFVLYLARQGWKTRDDWQIGPPWSASTQYLKKFHQEFGHLLRHGYGQQVSFYILKAWPATAKRLDEHEAHDLESIMQLLAVEKRSLLITGGASSGKTTFLQALALRASSPQDHRKLGFRRPRLPIYLPLKLIDTSLPFPKALRRALAGLGLSLKTVYLQRALKSGRALLLFDGLDEIPAGEQRERLCRWLDGLAQTAAAAFPLVITCKAEALLQNVRFEFPHFTVALRNYALLQYRSLRAVSETRMPPLYHNPVELEAEYILLSPPGLPLMLKGAKKPAPLYFYHLAKYPVTNKRYRAFVQATGHRPPSLWQQPDFAGDNLPVVGVDWEDAEAYCAWLTAMADKLTNTAALGKFVFRLPTEEEWEWAAGNGERTYPWGFESPRPEHANFADDLCRLQPVDAHPAGATPLGIHDLAGNVWEWTATKASEKPEKRVVRGGAAFNDAGALLCTARDAHLKQLSRFIGFRVARLPVE